LVQVERDLTQCMDLNLAHPVTRVGWQRSAVGSPVGDDSTV
jgi:hypothetical protein